MINFFGITKENLSSYRIQLVRGNSTSHHLLGLKLHKTTTSVCCCTKHHFFMQFFAENTVVLIRKHNRPLKIWGSTHAQPPLNATDRAVLSPVPLDSKPSTGAAIHSSVDLASGSGSSAPAAGMGEPEEYPRPRSIWSRRTRH
jgi:hypothetical protein